MKSLVIATLMLSAAGSALAQSTSMPSHSGDAPLNVKFQDIKWQKALPGLGEGSPEIAILHVDPQARATQLMIRVPKEFPCHAALA
jgi:hypothetical protein